MKEFIKKQGNSSAESFDVSSPDLYRAPINHRGQDADSQNSTDESTMELTEVILPQNTGEDSDMNLTDLSVSPGLGELTFQIRREGHRPNDVSLLGDVTQVIKGGPAAAESNLDLSLNTTSLGSYKNIDLLAKKVLPRLNISIPDNSNNSMNTSQNNTLLDESESSTVRRSRRLANRSNENTPTTGKTPEVHMRTPQILLNESRRRTGSTSRSKQRKNVSLISTGNSVESKSLCNISRMSSINLLENSAESSSISLMSASDSFAEKQAAENQKRKCELVQVRDEKLALLKKREEEIREWEGKIKDLEEKIKVAQRSQTHPYATDLLEILTGS